MDKITDNGKKNYKKNKVTEYHKNSLKGLGILNRMTKIDEEGQSRSRISSAISGQDFSTDH